jgi:hypothetical protein
MKPFRKKGWEHYDKVQAILPNVTARGKHAFSPTSSIPNRGESSDDDEVMDETVVAGQVVDATTSAGGGGGHVDVESGERMDVDGVSAATSGASASKRKHSALEGGGGEASVSAAPSKSSRPSKKKTSAKPSSSSAIASSVSKKRPSKAVAEGITQAVALNGMQGSINRLTDIFEKSMSSSVPVHPQEAKEDLRNKALQLLQSRDEGLSEEEMVRVVNIFMRDRDVTGTYLALENDAVRRKWLVDLV